MHPSLQSHHSFFSVLACIQASLLCQVSCFSYKQPSPFLQRLPESWEWTSSPSFLLEPSLWLDCVWQLWPHMELPKPQHCFNSLSHLVAGGQRDPLAPASWGHPQHHVQRREKATEALEKKEQRALLPARQDGKSITNSHGTRCWTTVRPTQSEKRLWYLGDRPTSIMADHHYLSSLPSWLIAKWVGPIYPCRFSSILTRTPSANPVPQLRHLVPLLHFQWIIAE